MINPFEFNNIVEKKTYFKILPLKKKIINKILYKNLSYNSFNKGKFLSVNSLSKKIKENLKSFEK